jgi:hypothetical protein
MDTSTVHADDRALVAWLSEQPGGAVKMPDAQITKALGWGDNRARGKRAIDRLLEAGALVQRRGMTVLNRERVRLIIKEIGPHENRTEPLPENRTVRQEDSRSSGEDGEPFADGLPPAVRRRGGLMRWLAPRPAQAPEAPNALPATREPVRAYPVPQRPDAASKGPRARYSIWLWALAWSVCLYGVAINVSVNLTNSTSMLDQGIAIGTGVIPELILFMIPSRMRVMTGGMWWLGAAVIAIVFTFAFLNSLQNASNTMADRLMTRADRTTGGVATADRRVADARAARDKACRAGQGKSQACKAAKDDVVRLESGITAAESKVAATAKSADADFTRIVAFLTAGRIVPTADAFSVLWLALRTLIPLLGGAVLAMARR